MSLTLSYITSRHDCRIEWAFDSVARQVMEPIHVLVIDRYADKPERGDEIQFKFDYAFRRKGLGAKSFGCTLEHRAPKPSVWAGEHRLTKQDWFSAASVRNTAICLCKTSHIAFVDDLSVLMPLWLNAVQEAVEGNYIGCGAYKKVKSLVVRDGEPVGYVETQQGYDDRLRRVVDDVSPCTGEWLYGCSFVAPLEDLLEVGGLPELTDGLSGEDYGLGIALQNAGKHLKYDRRMLTLESEELHFAEPPMIRKDKGEIGTEKDKSHAALRIIRQSKYYPNYYEGGIRALREHVLAGNSFPIVKIPDRDWFDQQLLSEM